jgi:hypothetical protein
MKKNNAQVLVPLDMSNPPESHEKEAAWIIARHYNTTVEFLRRMEGYHIRTPDIVLDGVLYEMKSPKGTSNQNVVRQLKRATKQSRNIIFDARRTSVDDEILLSKIRRELQFRHSIRRFIFITKKHEILEIK